MKTAIVILNWNGAKLLEQFLPSIIEHSPTENSSIYVADNASTDNSIQIIKKLFPTVKVIQNKSNGGYAKGYNEALEKLNEDIFVLINSDIEVTKNWMEPILDEFIQNENTAIAQPKILDFKNKAYFEYAGAAGGFIDKYGFPFCRGRIFSHLEKDTSQYNDNSSIFWASGACLFIRSKVFKELDGFDVSYFAHQEEIDLCWRAHNLNYDVKYIGTSTIYHVGGATLSENSPFKTYLNFRNSLFNLIKNIPKSSLFGTIFIRLCFDGIAGIQFLLSGKFKHFVAILKAHFSFYTNFTTVYKKRNTNQKNDYYFTKSIVYKHFIRGVKVFSKL